MNTSSSNAYIKLTSSYLVCNMSQIVIIILHIAHVCARHVYSVHVGLGFQS